MQARRPGSRGANKLMSDRKSQSRKLLAPSPSPGKESGVLQTGTRPHGAPRCPSGEDVTSTSHQDVSESTSVLEGEHAAHSGPALGGKESPSVTQTGAWLGAQPCTNGRGAGGWGDGWYRRHRGEMLRRDQVRKEKQTKTEINAEGRGRAVTKPGRQRPQESPAARAPTKRGHSVSATHRPAQLTWSRDHESQRRCTAPGPCPPRGHRRTQWAGAGVTRLWTARPTAALESTRGEDWAGLSTGSGWHASPSPSVRSQGGEG